MYFNITTQLYNVISCLHLHSVISIFYTTLSRLSNEWIEAHNKITIIHLAVQTTNVVLEGNVFGTTGEFL